MPNLVAIAEEAARQISRKYVNDLAPVPVERIARDHGVKVQPVPLDDELSGMAFVKDGLAVIVVNAHHHPNRQRFTLAHELGHHILHREYLTNNVHVDKGIMRRDERSSKGEDLKEVQANAFAAELLMPRSILQRYVDLDINDEAAMETLARRLKVSSAALTYRLIKLGMAE